jgi:hypothetical protein
MDSNRPTDAELEARYDIATDDLISVGSRKACRRAMDRWSICKRTWDSYAAEVHRRLAAEYSSRVEEKRALYIRRIEAAMEGADRRELVALLRLAAQIEGVLATVKFEGTIGPVDAAASVAALKEVW